jgi:hypothetical protein
VIVAKVGLDGHITGAAMPAIVETIDRLVAGRRSGRGEAAQSS